MGMSETMPNPTNWVQFYQSQRSPQTPMFSDATVVTTTVTSLVSAPDHHQHSTGPVDGRVSKPIRRRSRASRRTPTTVLNTDTANFRAMVQQFTGGPVAPFASQGTYIGFGSNNQQVVNPNTAPTSAGGSYSIHFQTQPPPQNQLPYMFSSLGSPTPDAVVPGRADNFPNRLEDSSSPSNENKSEINNFMF
ncbi:VQ motif-containing protein 22-like [Capsicum annuum]|nr:VQ motif-containing protein 22-like [Capsicum annuum]